MSESKLISILFSCKGKNCKGNLIDLFGFGNNTKPQMVLIILKCTLGVIWSVFPFVLHCIINYCQTNRSGFWFNFYTGLSVYAYSKRVKIKHLKH